MSETTTQNTPRYKHMCPYCIFLGSQILDETQKSYDLYFCSPSEQMTVLARFGEGENDFFSGLWNVQTAVNRLRNEAGMSFTKAISTLIEQSDKNIPLKSVLMAVDIAFKSNFINEEFELSLKETPIVNTDSIPFYTHYALNIRFDAHITHCDGNYGILVYQYHKNSIIDFSFVKFEKFFKIANQVAESNNTTLSPESIDQVMLEINKGENNLSLSSVTNKVLWRGFQIAIKKNLIPQEQKM